MRTILAAAGLILGLTSGPAITMAGEPIDESHSAVKNGTVVIENMTGSVNVEGWNKNEVSVTGTLGDGAERLDFEVDGKRTSIEVVIPEHKDGKDRWNHRQIDPTHLTVKIPAGSQVRLHGINLEASVENVEGDVEIETVNGDLLVNGSPEEIHVQTVNGKIQVTASSDQVSVKSVNGDLVLQDVEGDVTASSVNGNIRVTGGAFNRGTFSNISGDIEFEGDMESGSFDFQSHSGSVTLLVPRNVSADFELSTFSGEIENDFGAEASRKDKYVPGMELNFTTGSGDAHVSASSFSGKIEIKEN